MESPLQVVDCEMLHTHIHTHLHRYVRMYVYGGYKPYLDFFSYASVVLACSIWFLNISTVTLEHKQTRMGSLTTVIMLCTNKSFIWRNALHSQKHLSHHDQYIHVWHVLLMENKHALTIHAAYFNVIQLKYRPVSRVIYISTYGTYIYKYIHTCNNNYMHKSTQLTYEIPPIEPIFSPALYFLCSALLIPQLETVGFSSCRLLCKDVQQW